VKTARLSLVILATSLFGCGALVDSRVADWDEKLKEMCAKDGGKKIYEVISLPDHEVRRMQGRGLGIEEARRSSFPIYVSTERKILRESQPSVWREEVWFVRRSDGKILANSVTYQASAGPNDPSFAMPSIHGKPYLFHCPPYGKHSLGLSEVVREIPFDPSRIDPESIKPRDF
jgi:hypothetical protein